MALEPKTGPDHLPEESVLADRAKIEREIADLEAHLADLKARLPAHSIPPGMIAELDELDEALVEARARLYRLERQNQPK